MTQGSGPHLAPGCGPAGRFLHPAAGPLLMVLRLFNGRRKTTTDAPSPLRPGQLLLLIALRSRRRPLPSGPEERSGPPAEALAREGRQEGPRIRPAASEARGIFQEGSTFIDRTRVPAIAASRGRGCPAPPHQGSNSPAASATNGHYFKTARHCVILAKSQPKAPAIQVRD